MSEAPEVGIRDESIRLQQFLKLASLVETGGMAKEVIADGCVRVNDEVETRRGRQLVIGDVVTVAIPDFGSSSATVGRDEDDDDDDFDPSMYAHLLTDQPENNPQENL